MVWVVLIIQVNLNFFGLFEKKEKNTKKIFIKLNTNNTKNNTTSENDDDK